MSCSGHCVQVTKWAGLLALIGLFSWSVANHWLALDWFSAPNSSGRQFWVGSLRRDIRLGWPSFFVDGRSAFPQAIHSNLYPGFTWWIVVVDQPPVYAVFVPIWIVALVIAAPTALLWYRGRVHSGLCPVCQYPTGVSAVCTECGHRVTGHLTNRCS